MKRIIKKKDDDQILEAIRTVTDERPTYGYRRVTAMVRKSLEKPLNHKRIYRIMKHQGLLLQRHTGRPQRTHDGKIATIASNLRWCSDAFGILCWNGEQLQVAFSLDCCDREAMTWVTSTRGIDGELVRDLMTETLEARFGGSRSAPHKIQWLTDNGPGYVAYETVAFGRSLGFEICTTAPYSPESNGMAEAFVKTFKRDYVYCGDLSSAERVLEQLPRWFEDYNEQAPHKALKMMAPREYRRVTLAG